MFSEIGLASLTSSWNSGGGVGGGGGRAGSDTGPMLTFVTDFLGCAEA